MGEDGLGVEVKRYVESTHPRPSNKTRLFAVGAPGDPRLTLSTASQSLHVSIKHSQLSTHTGTFSHTLLKYGADGVQVRKQVCHTAANVDGTHFTFDWLTTGQYPILKMPCVMP